MLETDPRLCMRALWSLGLRGSRVPGTECSTEKHGHVHLEKP